MRAQESGRRGRAVKILKQELKHIDQLALRQRNNAKKGGQLAEVSATLLELISETMEAAAEASAAAAVTRAKIKIVSATDGIPQSTTKKLKTNE